MSIISKVKDEFTEFHLTDTYRSKQFTKNFDKHISSMVDIAINLAGDNRTILTDSNFSITDELYWDMEAYILENLDTVTDSEILNDLDNLEDFLYDKIIASLGNNYDKSSALNLMIDNSVHDTLLAVKFQYFTRKDDFYNPWEDAKNILMDNQMLFTFSADSDKLNSLGFKVKSNDSEHIADKKINIVAKGKRSNYAYGYVRDLVALRNTVLDILDEYNSDQGNAMKTETIINKLRNMNLHESEFSDSNIKNWLIAPLKRYNRIGSHNEGFFLLKNCADVEASYNSHFENFKGFFRTLENHRRLASKFGCANDVFDQHRNFLSNYTSIE